MVSAARFSVIHFQGRFIRQVSCYTLLSGCRLPWPPSCCLNEPTPFVGSLSAQFDALTMLTVHPVSPVLLTKSGPLDRCFQRRVQSSNCPLSCVFKVWESTEDIASPNTLIIRFTTQNNISFFFEFGEFTFFCSHVHCSKILFKFFPHHRSAILRETSEGTSY